MTLPIILLFEEFLKQDFHLNLCKITESKERCNFYFLFFLGAKQLILWPMDPKRWCGSHYGWWWWWVLWFIRQTTKIKNKKRRKKNLDMKCWCCESQLRFLFLFYFFLFFYFLKNLKADQIVNGQWATILFVNFFFNFKNKY